MLRRHFGGIQRFLARKVRIRWTGNRGRTVVHPSRNANSLEASAISTAPLSPFVHSLGRPAFQTFGFGGWTNQADRLPWRPYGLIRANIISEDTRKNRRISENSFDQLAGFLFFSLSLLLPPFLSSLAAGRPMLKREDHRSLAPFIDATNSSLT